MCIASLFLSELLTAKNAKKEKQRVIRLNGNLQENLQVNFQKFKIKTTIVGPPLVPAPIGY